MSVLGVTIGNTDGNIIDFVVFGILHGLSTKWYMVPVVAAIWFVVYYIIFRFAITRFNLKTPGRDSEVASSIEKAVAGAPGKSGYNVPAILEALGGADNIVSLDNCITRLRLSVKDMSLVNVQALKDMVPVVAAIWFVVYYIIFRFAITRFNLKTPGRDSEVASSIEKAVAGAPGKSGYNVPAILEALGGADNIVSLDNCITRLRLSVKDMSLVNVQALKDNRAIGVVQLNQHNLQVVIGPQVQSVKDEMAGLMHTVQA